MYWSHADEATYVKWMTQAGFDVQWTRFIPEGDSGHSLILARRKPIIETAEEYPANEQTGNKLTPDEAEVITSALESGRKWCRRGRTGYSLDYIENGFRITEMDEEREDAFTIRERERFIEWLCDLDLTIRGYSNSWSFLRMDFDLETLEEWTVRKDELSGEQE